MEIVKHEMPDNYKLLLMSDIHLGTKFHHKKGFDRVIDRLKTEKDLYAVVLGDLVEGRPADHPFFDIDCADPECMLPTNQYRAFKKKIEPVKDKIKALMWGNHDYGLLRKIGNLIKDDICQDLEIPYGGVECKVHFNSPKGKWKLYAHHGFGTISSNAKDPEQEMANLKASLKKKLKRKAGDCLVMGIGHTHRLIIAEPSYRLELFDDGSELVQDYATRHKGSKFIPADERYYVNTGSFHKSRLVGTEGYAERFGLEPTELGCVEVFVENGDVVAVKPFIV